VSILNLRAVEKRYNSNSVAVINIDLEVAEGELLALVGESGCGKTTLLRLIAGLEEPDRGSIEIENTQVAGNMETVPPQQRPVGFVFQDYALFPHMTVARNVLFGLYSWADEQARQRVIEVLKLVNLTGLENRYPHQLSGGQQQRVAMARALAPKPKLLLLDEPFSNLDTVLKDQVRQELSIILKRSGTTVILVTHDVQDALSMADRIAVLKDGNLLQVGSPETLYQRPINTYIASFFGKANLIPATCSSGEVVSELGTFQSKYAGKSGMLCLRPQHLHVVKNQQEGIAAEIVALKFMGEHQQLKLKIGTCDLWCHEPIDMNYQVGQQVILAVDLNQIHIIETTVNF